MQLSAHKADIFEAYNLSPLSSYTVNKEDKLQRFSYNATCYKTCTL